MKNEIPAEGPVERPAIRVRQPLGDFYAFSLRADHLNRISYSFPAEAVERMEQEDSETRGGYSILGSQRAEKPRRLDEIASFIRTTDATFPNAIILGVNYDRDGRYIEEESERWKVTGEGERLTLHIPSLKVQSASIIDGQHRLHAFERLPPDAIERSMELLCVVFLELPTPYHAYVFATINFNQKKVSRSDAYEMFGFDVDERQPRFWSPETLAVYITRLLNTEPGSPLYRCIIPTADSAKLFEKKSEEEKLEKEKLQVTIGVRVSIATMVDGILRLISKNPREDRNTIRRPENKDKGRSCLVEGNGMPLRSFYISGNDKAIYELLVNYFSAVNDTVWKTAGAGSYLRKTVGVQALFDALRVLLSVQPRNWLHFERGELAKRLSSCSNLDPSGDKYQASGIGRSEIRSDLLTALRLT